MKGEQLGRIGSAELLQLFSDLMEELRRRGVVRSSNNPVADYAESLVSRALELDLLPRSTKGYDASDKQGRKYEIKARRPTQKNKSRQLSVLRELDKKPFDFLAGVLFKEDFGVERACLIPHEVVLRLAEYRKHVNGWILHLKDNV